MDTDATPEQVTYITTDHLLTPRLMTDATQTITWRWNSDGFGATAPNSDPDGDSVASNLNLRFPGQYADFESGYYYNWHRYYDPAIGQYVTSDPIGLVASLNTYSYVDSNPTKYFDLWGLAKCVYSISSRSVVCTTDDGRSEQVGPSGVHSGRDECRDNPSCADEKDKGPTQPDVYEMVPSNKYGGSYWLKEGFVKRQLCKLGVGRCEFFFHEGTFLAGCITVDKNNQDAVDQFNRIKDLLRGETNNTMTVVP